MNRSPLLHLAAPAASVALLATLGLGGIAYAQDTGPDTEACAGATAELEASLEAATQIGLAFPVPQIEVDRLQGIADDETNPDSVTAQQKLDLRLELMDLQDAADSACAPPDDADSGDDASSGEPPQPEPTTPPADTDPPYESCLEAQEAGVITPTVRGINDGYQANLDGDGDGVSCEADEGAGNGTGPGDDTTGDSGAGDFDSPATTVPRGGVDTGWVG